MDKTEKAFETREDLPSLRKKLWQRLVIAYALFWMGFLFHFVFYFFLAVWVFYSVNFLSFFKTQSCLLKIDSESWTFFRSHFLWLRNTLFIFVPFFIPFFVLDLIVGGIFLRDAILSFTNIPLVWFFYRNVYGTICLIFEKSPVGVGRFLLKKLLKIKS